MPGRAIAACGKSPCEDSSLLPAATGALWYLLRPARHSPCCDRRLTKTTLVHQHKADSKLLLPVFCSQVMKASRLLFALKKAQLPRRSSKPLHLSLRLSACRVGAEASSEGYSDNAVTSFWASLDAFVLCSSDGLRLGGRELMHNRSS